MSKVFAIRDDGLKFKELDLEMRDVRRQRPESVPLDDVLKFHIRNSPLLSWWKTPETEFISLTDESAPIPDISPWIYSTLVLSPKAYRFLGELLTGSGEFLPVEANGETFYIFNCFVAVDADEEKCQYDYEADDGTKMGITHLEFLESASENLVLKTSADFCVTLFCNEKFKNIIESFDLTGVRFDTNLIQFLE
jgi:hypothetical protein